MGCFIYRIDQRTEVGFYIFARCIETRSLRGSIRLFSELILCIARQRLLIYVPIPSKMEDSQETKKSWRTLYWSGVVRPPHPRLQSLFFAHVTNSIQPLPYLSLFLSRFTDTDCDSDAVTLSIKLCWLGRHNFKFYAIYKMSRHYFCRLDLSLHTFGPSDNPIYVGVP